MSANGDRNDPKVLAKEAESVPVKELPMPPVKIQKPDSSGGVALMAKKHEDTPLPQLAAIQLRLPVVA